MKTQLSILSLAVLLTACGSDSSSSSSGEDKQSPEDKSTAAAAAICNNGETLPAELLGKWKRSFERNGSQGTYHLEFTTDCKYKTYEIGNHAVMEEWYSPLPEGVIYRFEDTPYPTAHNFVDSSFTLTSVSATARIYNNETNEVVQTWPIQSAGATATYTVKGKTLTLSSEFGGVKSSTEFQRN